MSRTLSAEEMHRWVQWKRATDRVWQDVLDEITHATGLSGADFSVLTRAVESHEPLRQQDLAEGIGWSRSRLSRHVSRMEARGLVRRTATTSSTTVVPTDTGRELAATARTAHATAVRRALLHRVEPDAGFWDAVEALGRPQD